MSSNQQFGTSPVGSNTTSYIRILDKNTGLNTTSINVGQIVIVEAVVLNLMPNLTSHLKDCYLKSNEKSIQIINNGKTVPIFGSTITILPLELHNRAAFQMKAFRVGKSTRGELA